MGRSPYTPSLAVLGAGSWGTALAIHLAKRYPLTLWVRDAMLAKEMQAQRTNDRYLPGHALSPTITITDDLAQVLAHARWLFLAMPVAGVRSCVQEIVDSGHDPVMVLLSKGTEKGSGLFPHQIVQQLAPTAKVGLLSGPTFAKEVAQGLPTAATLATSGGPWSRQVATVVHDESFRVYLSRDMTGVAVCGAIKNVLAIAAGLCDSLNLGYNARAALLTRGLSEMARLGTALGARPKTFMGLAGIGDLLLTATGDLSRNRQVGLRLGRGEALASILASLGHVSEGVAGAAEILQVARKVGVELPITTMVVQVLSGHYSSTAALRLLLERPPGGSE